MNYIGIIKEDIKNGPGLRTTLFVQGCNHRCEGCFNPESWSFDGHHKWTEEKKNKFIKLASRDIIDGISLLGGDPLWCPDDSIAELVEEYKRLNPNKTIWLWTGFTFEEIYANENITSIRNNADWMSWVYRTLRVLQCVDVLVEGRFKKDLAIDGLLWRGSTNQRFIDMQESIRQNKLIPYNISIHK